MCSGLMIFDTNLGGKTHRTEVFNGNKTMKEAKIVTKQPGTINTKPHQMNDSIPPTHLIESSALYALTPFDVEILLTSGQGGRWVYLAVIVDLYQRRIVGWLMSNTPDATLVINALEHAYQQRGKQKDLLFHSNQGSQYTNLRFRQRLWRYHIIQSMSRRGNCWDNAPMEQVFRRLKTEWFPVTAYTCLEQARLDVSSY